MALYVLWLICFVPYDLLEIYYLKHPRLYNDLFKDSAPAALKDNIGYANSLYSTHQITFSGIYRKFIIVEAFLGNLRFAYGFFNSILLLILLRPFREPPKKLYNSLVKACK